MSGAAFNTGRLVCRASVAGVLAGTVVSTVMTGLDCYANPGGVFRSEGVTCWPAVAETAWRWLWPVAILVGLLALPVVGWLERREGSRKGHRL